MAIELKAEIRTEIGKGAARRARRAGHLPGVIYSKGKESTLVNLVPAAFTKAMKSSHRRNTVLDINTGSGNHTVMVRDIQIHPVKRFAKHVDLWEIDSSKPVEVRVPLKTTGKSEAITLGARLNIVLRTVKVSVLPGKIPEVIEHDITNAGMGPTRASELKMPEGCTLIEDGELTVLTLSRVRIKEDPTLDAAPAAGGAEGGAAPAAEGEATADDKK